MPLALKFLHVLIAIAYVSGLVGRQIALRQAAQEDSMQRLRALLKVTGACERYLVIPGSMAVLVFGLATAWAQGLPLLGFVQGGHVNWVLAALVVYLSQMPLVPLVFLPRGAKFGAALEASNGAGRPLPALHAAFDDRVVAASHVYEFGVVVVLVFLMVAKPF